MGPAVKFFQGKEWERGGAAAVVVEEAKLDRLGSLEMRRERKGRGSCRPEQQRPREPSSPIGAVPLENPGLASWRQDSSGQGRRSSLTSGLKLLWAELREASAVASASRGSSRLRAGRGVGDMVRDRSSSRAVRAPRRGPSPGVAPPLPWAPLSSGGTEFGFLERCPLGDEAIVLESACLLVLSSSFFDLSSA